MVQNTIINYNSEAFDCASPLSFHFFFFVLFSSCVSPLRFCEAACVHFMLRNGISRWATQRHRWNSEQAADTSTSIDFHFQFLGANNAWGRQQCWMRLFSFRFCSQFPIVSGECEQLNLPVDYIFASWSRTHRQSAIFPRDGNESFTLCSPHYFRYQSPSPSFSSVHAAHDGNGNW